MTYTIAALYHFAAFPDYAATRAPLLALCEAKGVFGSILLASEGVNGTIAGSRDGIDAVLGYLRALPGFAALAHKESFATERPFMRMKVRLKREIVAMGAPGLDPESVGRYVAPKDWNALISQPDIAVIDTRNGYEVAIGSFAGALDPQTDSFRDFPAWAQEFRRQHNTAKVAMFCTGGIRCEKASAYMKSLGFTDVYHLKGGILQYLEDVPADQSLWQGECFVFDERVSVGHGLTPGAYTLCRACRRPVSPEGRLAPDYEDGVRCAACADEYSEEDRARFRERQKQVALAEARGARHIGG